MKALSTVIQYVVSEINYNSACVGVAIFNYVCSLFFYIDCEHGDLRLVGGETEYEGRVEVCVYGVWGTVCGTYRDRPEAEVICGQLGIDYASERFLLFFS